MSFASNLKAIRQKAQLTQEQLAEKSGMHRLGIAKLERGEREPTWESVQSLAAALGVSCEEFQVSQGDVAGKKPTKKTK